MGIAGDFVLIIVAGLIGGISAHALRLPLLVGYIVAGVAVGPYTAGPTITNVDEIELLAEIGVALLLFAIGLEVSLRDLGPVRLVALLGGPLQILLTLAFGAVLVRGVAGVPWRDAAWFGAMVSLSSTMVVLKVLSADGTTATLASRVMIGLLVVQDLAVVPMLILLPRLGPSHTADGGVLRAVATAAAFLAGMFLLGARLLPAVLRRAREGGSRELFVMTVVAVGVGVGLMAYRLGLSFAIGAFLAGLVLSESEFSHQALADVAPLRDVFALLFFVSVGMLLDPRYVVAHLGEIAAIVAVLVVGKAVIAGGVARLFGYVFMAPWLVGLGLAQIGEFGFVLSRIGLQGGFLTKETYDLALACTVVSMALSPVIFRAAGPLGRAWQARFPSRVPAARSTAPPAAAADPVIVAGYGNVGRTVGTALRAVGMPTVVVELNHHALAAAEDAGHTVIWGDVSNSEVLAAAGVERARVLVLAVPDWTTTRLAIDRARELAPRVPIVARSSASTHVGELAALGVRAIVRPELEAGIEMMRHTLRTFGADETRIETLVTDLRSAQDVR